MYDGFLFELETRLENRDDQSLVEGIDDAVHEGVNF